MWTSHLFHLFILVQKKTSNGITRNQSLHSSHSGLGLPCVTQWLTSHSYRSRSCLSIHSSTCNLIRISLRLYLAVLLIFFFFFSTVTSLSAGPVKLTLLLEVAEAMIAVYCVYWQRMDTLIYLSHSQVDLWIDRAGVSQSWCQSGLPVCFKRRHMVMVMAPRLQHQRVFPGVFKRYFLLFLTLIFFKIFYVLAGKVRTFSIFFLSRETIFIFEGGGVEGRSLGARLGPSTFQMGDAPPLYWPSSSKVNDTPVAMLLMFNMMKNREREREREKNSNNNTQTPQVEQARRTALTRHFWLPKSAPSLWKSFRNTCRPLYERDVC